MSEEWFGIPPGSQREDHQGNWPEIPRFDKNWAVTGPLIELFGFNVFRDSDGTWEATEPDDARMGESGATPLLAACALIVALWRADKLKVIGSDEAWGAVQRDELFGSSATDYTLNSGIVSQYLKDQRIKPPRKD